MAEKTTAQLSLQFVVEHADKAAKEIEKVAKASDKVTKASKKLSDSLIPVDKNTKKNVDSQKKLKDNLKKTGNTTSLINIRMLKLSKTLARQKKDWTSLGISMETGRKAINNNRKAVNEVDVALVNLNKTGLLTVRNTRNIHGSFSVLRSQLLLASFAVNLVDRAVLNLVKAFAKQELAGIKLTNTLRASGYAAGITKSEIISLTKELQRNGVVGDEVNMQMASLMLTYTKIGKDVFPRALKAANDMATSIEMNIPTAEALRSKVTMLSKALQDPIRGMTALRKVGFTLTTQQEKLIKSFVNSGDIISAQNLILEAAELQYGDMADKVRDSAIGEINALSMAFGDLQERVGSVLGEAIIPLVGWLTEMAESLNTRKVKAYVAVLEVAGIAMMTYVLWLKRAVFWQTMTGWGALATGLGFLAAKFLETSEMFDHWDEKVEDGNPVLEEYLQKGSALGQAMKDLGGDTKEAEFIIDSLNQQMESFKFGNLPHMFIEFQGVLGKFGQAFSSLDEARSFLSGLRAEFNFISPAQQEMVDNFQDQIDVLNEANPMQKEYMKVAKELGIELQDLHPTLKQIIEDYWNLVAAKKAEIIETQAGIEKTKAESEARIEVLSALSSATESYLMTDNQRHLDNEKSKLQAELDANAKSRKSDKAKQKEKERIQKDMDALEKQQHNRQLLIKQLSIAIDAALGIARIKIAQASAEALIRAKYALLPGGQAIAEAEVLAMKALNTVSIGTLAASAAIGITGIQAQKYAKGGDFITDRPEMIMVGEAGRERVTITPVDRPEERALGSMGGVTVNFTGNVLSQDFIEDEAIPMIKEALRRGADLDHHHLSGDKLPTWMA